MGLQKLVRAKFREQELERKKMAFKQEDPPLGKVITQQGILILLYKLIADKGGEINVKCSDLTLKPGNGLRMDYHAIDDSFTIKTVKIELPPSIVTPNKRIIASVN